jgi:uncharacterized protein involved in exopolysaccharide biosynthesis
MEPVNDGGDTITQATATGAHGEEVMIDSDSGREVWPTRQPPSLQRALLRHAWLIPVSGLLVALLAYVVAGRQTPTYTAVGRIFLAASVPVSGQPTEDIARIGATQATMLVSNVVIRDAEKTVNLHAGALTGKVNAVFATEASYITLSVSAPTAKDAALRAIDVEELTSAQA